MNRQEGRAQIEEVGILPSVRFARRTRVIGAETEYVAGIPVVEITLTMPGALNIIRDLATRRFVTRVREARA